MPSSVPVCDFSSAVRVLLGGGILFFPTETFYACGCLTVQETALEAVYAMKRRDRAKPLPVACATMEQVRQYIRLEEIPQTLLSFWPGPMTLVHPVHEDCVVDDRLLSARREIAVRVSSRPLVRSLVAACRIPLTVSSANISGEAPVVRHTDLDGRLLACAEKLGIPCGIVAEDVQHSQARRPSTLVRIVRQAPCTVEILRPGIITEDEFRARGILVEGSEAQR